MFRSLFPRVLFPLALLACTGTDKAPDADGDGWTTTYDCDDAAAEVHPDAAELCDGIDQDCDGEIDEGATDATAWYADGDGDGYGDMLAVQLACTAPEGTAATGDDCDDADPAFHPGAAEADCTDPADYNCDGSVGYADADGDGFAACADCDDADSGVNPEAPETCDGTDQDCDGATDEDPVDGASWYADGDGDGYGAGEAASACSAPAGTVANADDCDDASAAVNPGATETCNEADDDCDGAADEDASDAIATYADGDGDGFGAGSATWACTPAAGWVTDDTDCDDAQASVNPAASEVCDGIDDDCDGAIDDGDDSLDPDGILRWTPDFDGDGYGDSADSFAWTACTAPDGYLADGSDCDDSDGAVNPGATEVCDGLDNNCDSRTDDASADPATMVTSYTDDDGDGYGAGDGSLGCLVDGMILVNDDCADWDANIHPGATERCDTMDSDCDGVEFFDQDFSTRVPDAVLSINGDAVQNVDAGVLTLTTAANDQHGTAAFVQRVSAGFWYASMDFEIVGDESGADGMTLYFLDETDPSVVSTEGGGGGLSVAGLPGYAVAIDPFNSDGPHVALLRTSDMSTLAQVAIADPRGDGPHALGVQFASGRVRVSWDDELLFDSTIPDFASTDLLLGMSAATGGLYEEHDVHALYVTCWP